MHDNSVYMYITSLSLGSPGFISLLASVVQKVDNAIHHKNHHPLDGAGFPNTYLLDSDPVDSMIQLFNNWGLVSSGLPCQLTIILHVFLYCSIFWLNKNELN